MAGTSASGTGTGPEGAVGPLTPHSPPPSDAQQLPFSHLQPGLGHRASPRTFPPRDTGRPGARPPLCEGLETPAMARPKPQAPPPAQDETEAVGWGCHTADPRRTSMSPSPFAQEARGLTILD